MDPRPDDVELVPDGASAWVLRVGGTDQSHVDLADPTRLDFDYVQRMAEVVDEFAPPGDPLRVVHVGGAAMTLPRYVAATRPGSAQTVLEPAEGITALVREHLPLPRRSGIKVRPVPGRPGLGGFRDGHADVVVLDAFDGARVPADLVTLEALAEMARVLRPDGVAVLNVADATPFAWTRRLLAGVRATFSDVLVGGEPSTLKGRRHGNLVVTASCSPLPVDALRRRSSGAAFPYRTLHGSLLHDTLGGGAAFTDADSEASPPPPTGRTVFS